MIKFGGLAQGQGLAAAIDLRTAGLCPQTLRQLFGAWASTPGRTGASKWVRTSNRLMRKLGFLLSPG